MSEAPIYPIAPALANALTDATGIRFYDSSLTPDRIYRRIFESTEKKPAERQMKRESSRRALASALMLCAICLVSVCAGDALSADALPQPASSSSRAASSTPTPSIASAFSSANVEPISGNPGAFNIIAGTGLLGRSIGLDKLPGVRVGGLWIGNGDYLITGGLKPRHLEFQQPAVAELGCRPRTTGRHSGSLDGREAAAVQW